MYLIHMNVKYKYYEYEIFLYANPEELTNDDIVSVLKKMEYVNRKSNTKLEYGIFDKTISLLDKITIFKNMNVSILNVDSEPVGFSYQYQIDRKVDNKPVLHQGLFVSHKNPGRDITIINLISCLQFFKLKGESFSTMLTSAPFAVGQFARVFSNVWPSPYIGQKNPPDKNNYKQVAEACFERYIQPFFPFPDNLTLDLKRFVVISKALEMGFEVDMRKMSRDDDLMTNLFCQFWLDYEKQEIMLQVGKIDKDSSSRTEEIMKQHNIVLEPIK